MRICYESNAYSVYNNLFTYFYNTRIYNEMKARSKKKGKEKENGEIYQFDIV